MELLSKVRGLKMIRGLVPLRLQSGFVQSLLIANLPLLLVMRKLRTKKKQFYYNSRLCIWCCTQEYSVSQREYHSSVGQSITRLLCRFQWVFNVTCTCLSIWDMERIKKREGGFGRESCYCLAMFLKNHDICYKTISFIPKAIMVIISFFFVQRAPFQITRQIYWSSRHLETNLETNASTVRRIGST